MTFRNSDDHAFVAAGYNRHSAVTMLSMTLLLRADMLVQDYHAGDEIHDSCSALPLPATTTLMLHVNHLQAVS